MRAFRLSFFASLCLILSQSAFSKPRQVFVAPENLEIQEKEPSIDREGVRRVIRANLKDIKECYQKDSDLHPDTDLEGKVVVTLEIDDSGQVQKSSVKSSTLPPPSKGQGTAECVSSLVKALSFPKPRKGSIAVIDYPFVFGRSKSK